MVGVRFYVLVVVDYKRENVSASRLLSHVGVDRTADHLVLGIHGFVQPSLTDSVPDASDLVESLCDDEIRNTGFAF